MSEREPNEVMGEANEEHKPVYQFALYSGGNDSLVSTHAAMENGAHEVLHVNTGIGVEATREHVRETCKKFGWPLREEHPPELTYREMVLKFGFPGPGAHIYPYSWLKERAIAKVVRETKQKFKDRVALITGVRNQESARRMGFVKPVVREGARVWVANIFNFSKIALHDYIRHYNLPINPVTKIIGMSGECFCGAFAEPDELEKKIRPNFPDLAAQIDALQEEAEAAGVHCKWGTRPAKWRTQQRNGQLPLMPLCAGCTYKPKYLNEGKA